MNAQSNATGSSWMMVNSDRHFSHLRRPLSIGGDENRISWSHSGHKAFNILYDSLPSRFDLFELISLLFSSRGKGRILSKSHFPAVQGPTHYWGSQTP